MAESNPVRVSDQERERTASELREHFAQGRLDTEELEDRLSRAYAARTAEELEALRVDLPQLPATRATQHAELAERRSALTRELAQHTGGALVPFLICTIIWLGSGANGSFWPAWVAIVALIPLVRNGWRLYGPSPQLDHVEQELAARRRDERRRRRHDGSA